ncbi:NAD(P)-dependent oxidoreductase [Psychroflexus tropicus]|uniref:NAD(P)-dependent oxidoreductase n=1 Tax=Psychroflexus tropicus TaxID=197345 RepID=UPI0003A4FBA4|nr:SDR family oxidoreductase [Psychroflexus tropicus]
MVKTIALFGATGRTGQHFLNIALEAGFSVKALVRNPAKLNVSHSQLSVLKGDVLNRRDVEETVSGTDLVVSLFGHVKGSPKWLQTDGTRHIVEAMKTCKVKRIISLSGGGLPYPEKDQPKLADKLIRSIMKLLVPHILEDAKHHHEVLAESNTIWTIVRAPRLTNAKRQGFYRVGWVGENASTKISRADLADFILNQIKDETYSYQMPFVSG